MINFLIQTIDGEVKHEFSFHLRESIRFNNWFANEVMYEEILSEKPDKPNSIPVGSIEFVLEYLDRFHSIPREEVKPLQIPISLLKDKYLKRKVDFLQHNELKLEGKPIFIKCASEYKGMTDIITEQVPLPEGEYFISEVIDIDSEWRAFVFQDELVGLKNYLGDFTNLPDVNLIKEMVSVFKDSPPAYTLDVGVNKDGTFLIEVHPFFSCGLYGFQNYKILAPMFSQTFNWLVKKYK